MLETNLVGKTITYWLTSSSGNSSGKEPKKHSGLLTKRLKKQPMLSKNTGSEIAITMQLILPGKTWLKTERSKPSHFYQNALVRTANDTL